MTAPKTMPVSAMSEAEAIEGAKQGDGDCFEYLYALHKMCIYNLCLRMIGKVEAAEDLTQEAFLRLHRKIASFRGESAFSNWLHRIAVNVILMHLRKHGLPMASLDESLEPTEESRTQKDYASEDQVLAGTIDRIILERAMDNLPPGCRIVFVLHDIEGYAHNEIAEMMGCSIGNSTAQLHTARGKLRAALNITRTENGRRKASQIERVVTVATGRGSRAATTAA